MTGCAINGIAAQLSEELNRLTLQNKIFTKSTCMLQYENLQYKEVSMTSQNIRQLFINDWEIEMHVGSLKNHLIYTNTRILNISY